MNAAKYFTPKYWARKLFAIKLYSEGGANIWVYVGTGNIVVAGAANSSRFSIRYYTGSEGVVVAGAAATIVSVVYAYIASGATWVVGTALYFWYASLYYAAERIYLFRYLVSTSHVASEHVFVYGADSREYAFEAATHTVGTLPLKVKYASERVYMFNGNVRQDVLFARNQPL